MSTLVAGGSGFVGRHLVARLLDDGHAVRVMTRHPGPRSDGAQEVFGDVAELASLAPALDGVEVAYYLVHTLERADFAARDRAGAIAFAHQCARSGVRRVCYLGGLGDERDRLSAHLRSRREVEQILLAEAPTIALRAGIVVGHGSVSWEILCQLVERLPGMVTPRWVQTRTQPIAVDDVVAYLAALPALERDGEHYEIGTPDPTTYRDMLLAVARERGKRLPVVPVPVLSPRLSSWWLRLVTDVDLQTARTLVDSMSNEVVVRERRLERLTGHLPMTFIEAARRALAAREGRVLDQQQRARHHVAA